MPECKNCADLKHLYEHDLFELKMNSAKYIRDQLTLVNDAIDAIELDAKQTAIKRLTRIRENLSNLEQKLTPN